MVTVGAIEGNADDASGGVVVEEAVDEGEARKEVRKANKSATVRGISPEEQNKNIKMIHCYVMCGKCVICQINM